MIAKDHRLIGNMPDVAERLIVAGATTEAEAHGAGGTPLVVALIEERSVGYPMDRELRRCTWPRSLGTWGW